jgi:prolyl-tRNA synthetase
LADTGESAIFYDKKFDELSQQENLNIAQTQKIYAMADDLHVPEKCPIASEHLVSRRGIEVGQVFNFGQKYSKAMEAKVMGPKGEKIYPNMGSYGIGVSRVVAAAIEANHDDKGIIWPKPIAPFAAVLINARNGDELCDQMCNQIYQDLLTQNFEILYDDTKVNLGQKLSIADLIGIPTQIILGPNSAAAKKVEVKNRQTGEKKELNISDLTQFLLSQ